MTATLRYIEQSSATITFRIARAAPTLMLFGPAAAIAALLTAWLAGLRWTPAG
jgi:hypothetical protein